MVCFLIILEPGFGSGGFTLYRENLKNELFDALIEQVQALNKDIYRDDSLGKGFRIGHSYFCGLTECKDETLKEIVEYDILPMLNEYWFDDPSKVQKWENQLRGVFDE